MCRLFVCYFEYKHPVILSTSVAFLLLLFVCFVLFCYFEYKHPVILSTSVAAAAQDSI